MFQPVRQAGTKGAQFVNWLNTSTGHQAAYKFTGTQGTSDYTLDIWSAAEADNVTNLYRHKDAFYFLPTEDEWVKSAYWNGINLQTWATSDDSVPVAGGHTNYDWAVGQPWSVVNGSEELNGTFDMMGNVFEWVESPYFNGDYLPGSIRGLRGGAYYSTDGDLKSSYRYDNLPNVETETIGFRVASVPEPCTVCLLAIGGVALIRKRRY
jgi:formylglycine-generating enzyme required for sulfatase activity